MDGDAPTGPTGLRGPFRTDLRARAAYAEGAGIYRILPAAACQPTDLDDLRALLAWATRTGVALVPRGAGSAMPGNSVGDGVVVDLTRLAPQRLEVDPEARRAVTGAAVRWGELTTAAAAHGLRLPPDPSSGRWITLGGMVSCNAAGARTVRYGPARAWVEGLTLLTADGQLAELRRGRDAAGTTAAERRFAAEAAPTIRAAANLVRERFPGTRKNTAGYALDAWLASGDLLDLVIGAEGTLGLVTEITWRLDPIPAHRASLRVVLGDLDSLADVVPALLALEPSALELLDRTFLDVVPAVRLPEPVAALGAGAQAVLLVDLEADDPRQLRGAVSDAARLVRPLAADVTVAADAAEAGALWELRHAASPILAALPLHQRSLQVVEDGCVPVPRLGQYVAAVRGAAAARGVPAVIFGHAGDGHVHVNLLADTTRAGWMEDLAAIHAELADVVARLGGTPSGEHGDGRLRTPLLGRIYGPEVTALFALVKRAFDPAGILNPGVKVPAPGAPPPVSRLKVGADATPLPDDVARALREIERSGGYATDRMELAG